MPSKKTIRLTSRSDRWRFVCPRGHRSWEPTNYHFWCQQCAQYWEDIDPEFDELHDLKTDDLLAREQIVLEVESGLPEGLS